MKLLSKFDEYIVELKIEEALRNFPLFLSKRLRDLLSNIDHEIATELLSKHSDLDTRVKQAYVDIHKDKADAITFIQPNKAAQVLGWEGIEDDDQLADKLKDVSIEAGDGDDVFTKYRGETRWGRFIQAAFPGKYEQSLPGGQNKQDIESFVNLYKALYDRDEKFAMLDIVDGAKIAHFYNCDNYATSNGTLGDSCMARKSASYFQLYTNNPDKVSMVIMYSNDRKNKIKARALLWTLNVPEERKFMDRVYTNNYVDEQTFIDFAKQNNWLYKSRQGMGADINITDPSTDTSGSVTMMSELSPDNDYSRYPYLDTMSYYNPYSGFISNKYRIYNAKYELTDTGGGSYSASGYNEEPEWVYSKFHGEDIDKHISKYCKFGDDWVREDTPGIVRVWNSGGGENYAVPGFDGIVHSRFEYKKERDGEIQDKTYDKWFPRNKCIWSDSLNTWVFLWSADVVWQNLERTEYALEHKKREGDFYKKVNGEAWALDLVDDNGRLIGEVTPKLERPVGDTPRGWHRRAEYIDSDNNLWKKGVHYGKSS